MYMREFARRCHEYMRARDTVLASTGLATPQRKVGTTLEDDAVMRITAPRPPLEAPQIYFSGHNARRTARARSRLVHKPR